MGDVIELEKHWGMTEGVVITVSEEVMSMPGQSRCNHERLIQIGRVKGAVKGDCARRKAPREFHRVNLGLG